LGSRFFVKIYYTPSFSEVCSSALVNCLKVNELAIGAEKRCNIAPFIVQKGLFRCAKEPILQAHIIPIEMADGFVMIFQRTCEGLKV